MAVTSAIVIAGVLISASIFVAVGGAKTTTVTKTITSTSTATCAEEGSNATGAFVTDCTLGITLGLAGTQIVAFGQNNSVHVSLTNDQAALRNVNYTGLPALPHGFNPASSEAFDYVLPLQPSCGYPSTAGFEPAFIVVYNASGSPLQMSDSPLSVVNCISSAKNYHTFNASQTLSEAISVRGYWASPNPSEPWINATYHQFSSGNYTIIAFDLWGQLAELNFSVSPAANPITNAPKMLVNGSLYYADDITSDITIGFPGYSFFHNTSVTFLGVRFETYCPPSYGGCPIPPGVTETTVTTMMIGAIRLNATFADKSTESINALIGDDDYIFAFTHHAGPQAGVLIVYSGGFKAYLLVS